MRKISLLILVAIALTFSSCRKTPDYVPYIGETTKLAYSTYAEQFDVIWNNINTGYVFWDVDETDWDEVYERFIPQFEALDLRVESGDTVSTQELKALYEEAMGTLVDHHMYIQVKNIYSHSSDDVISIRPSDNEIKTRDYYYKSRSALSKELSQFIKKLAAKSIPDYKIVYSGYEVISTAEVKGTICYILFELPDGRQVPYLWQDGYMMNLVMTGLNDINSPYYRAAQLIDKWKTEVLNAPKDKLAGVILDNRCNSGGSQSDINYVISPFIKNDLEVMSTRYKEGSGRLEHSVWAPLVIYPSTERRDLASENIPYVVLTNIYSTSMGEITGYTISQLATGYVIGERTYGATGPLLNGAIDLTYGGPFGDMEREYHFVYTSTLEIKTHEGFVPEGIGFAPDKEVLTKDAGVKGQLDSALEYIMSY